MMKKFEITTNNGSENIITSYVIREYNPSLPEIMEEFSFLNKMELDIPSDCVLHFFVNHHIVINNVAQQEECILIANNENKYYIFHVKYRHLVNNSSVVNYSVDNLYAATLPQKLKILEHIDKAYVLYDYDMLQDSLPYVSGTIKRSKI